MTKKEILIDHPRKENTHTLIAIAIAYLDEFNKSKLVLTSDHFDRKRQHSVLNFVPTTFILTGFELYIEKFKEGCHEERIQGTLKRF